MKKNEMAKLILLGLTTGILIHSQPAQQEVDLEQDLIAYTKMESLSVGCFPCNHNLISPST